MRYLLPRLHGWLRDEDGAAHGPAMSLLLLMAAVVSHSVAGTIQGYMDRSRAQIRSDLDEQAEHLQAARLSAATGFGARDPGL